MGIISELLYAYKLRIRRKKLLFRAFRARNQLKSVVDRTNNINSNTILLIATVRNEIIRLPYFLEHHRKLGVRHFLFVDNDSDDGTSEFLENQSDVSLWHTKSSYKQSRFGIDWVTWLQKKYAHGHWCLTLDADELFIYSDWEKRNLTELTKWLDKKGAVSMAALMLDMYPKGPLSKVNFVPVPGHRGALPLSMKGTSNGTTTQNVHG